MTNREKIENMVRKYRIKTNTSAPIDKETEEYVVQGLTYHMDVYNKPLCPCRFYPEGKEESVKMKIYNCPCKEMRETKFCH